MDWKAFGSLLLLPDGNGRLFVLYPGPADWRFEEIDTAVVFGQTTQCRWLCSRNMLEVYFPATDDVAMKAVGELSSIQRISDYPSSFSFEENGEVVIILGGLEGQFAVHLDHEHVIAESTITARVVALCGSLAANDLVLGGMRPRSISSSGQIVDLGYATSLALREGYWETLDLNEELYGQIPRALLNAGLTRAQTELRWRAEACVGLWCFEHKALSLCALLPAEMDADSDWFLGAAITRADYQYFSLAERNDERWEIKRVIVGKYAGQVKHRGTTALIFLRGDRVREGSVSTLTLFMNARGDLVSEQEGAVLSDIKDAQICHMSLWAAERVGFYGCLGLYTERGYEYRLMISSDLSTWKVMGSLSSYDR